MNDQYQLVLQWRGEYQPPFDKLVELEEALIAGLGEFGDVDGHDMGSNESNIFVMTDVPQSCFERCLLILHGTEYRHGLAAGFSSDEDDDYVALWPAGSTVFSVT